MSFSPYHKEASYVTFDLSVPRGTSFGLYARRNALPTHTHYNFMEVSDMKKKQIVCCHSSRKMRKYGNKTCR